MIDNQLDPYPYKTLLYLIYNREGMHAVIDIDLSNMNDAYRDFVDTFH